MLKVRNGSGKEIPLVQNKEQRLCFAGAAVKRHPTTEVMGGDPEEPPMPEARASGREEQPEEQWLSRHRRA